MTLLIEGDVEDPRTQRIAALEADVRQLRRDLSDARIEADRAREDADRALGMLRRQLSPLYRALQAVFGELDAAGVSDESAPSAAAPSTATAGNPHVAAVWEAWKAKLSPSCGRVIDALLVHKELNIQQICVAARMGKNTVYDVNKQLNRAGLLTKNGNRFSLKQL